MKGILFSLVTLGLLVFGLTGSSQLGVQTAVAADTERPITWDVAIDCRTWRFNLGISLADFGRGDTFIANGKIFPGGTLHAGTQNNDPNVAGSIGNWIEHGTMAATSAEIAAGERPAFVATWFHLLNNGSVVAGGPHPDSGPMAVVGGTGDFRGAAGEIDVEIIGTNSTGCPNMRLKVSLQKQAPK